MSAPERTPSPAGSDEQRRKSAPLWLVIAAFAAVYVIWGSTYFGIKVAIESMPPLLMAGTRFFMAGCVLYGVMRLRGTVRPTAVHWKNATIIGALLLLAGNGGVSWAQQRVPSGIAALMVAAVPLWMNLLDWLRPGGKRPAGAVFAGIVLGFAGVAVIVVSKNSLGHNVVDPVGACLLIAAPISWAIGSIYSRHAEKHGSALLNIGMQMIAGGVLLALSGVVAGELPRVDLAHVTRASWIAYAYLTAIGSLVGFTAYVWLLQVSTPAKVSTYAFVNPFVAVLLGWLVAKEPLPPSVLVSGALVIAAVALITLRGNSPARRRAESREAEIPGELAPSQR